jgi:hypothetical protein
MRGILAALLATVVAAACQPPPPAHGPGHALGEPDGLLSTDRTAYRTGATATLTLHNRYADPLGYNLCFSSLERRDGSEWRPSPVQDDRVCAAVLHVLRPSGAATSPAQIPPALPPGEYRFRTRLENMRTNAEFQGHTNPFTVGI